MSEPEENSEHCADQGHTLTEEYHTCPFEEDVNNDAQFKCMCCDECEHQCAMDI